MPRLRLHARRVSDRRDKAGGAGAILIGKTNLDQFATGLVGVRSPYPVPRNAIDPALVPGGSSSGSAVAVAQGLVTFALGTDTAGSGRVPAALNNIVGLKPTVGAASTKGVVPACRTLDCVSVFALTVDDAWAAYGAMAGYDPNDAYSRTVPVRAGAVEPQPVIGVPREEDLRFFGDAMQEQAYRAALAHLTAAGARLKPIDMTPFFETAALLYEGPWVAERHAAIASVLARTPDIVHPVTRRIVEGANGFSASQLFTAQYRLQALRRETASVWREISMLAVPTTPVSPTLADLAADPIGPNSRCGTYTNFVNLLDLCALAVPGPFRGDGRAAGLTFIAPAGHDGRLAAFGRAVHASAGVALGATGAPVPATAAPLAAAGSDGLIEIVVVGAHLSGMPLNHELTGNGGVFRRAVATTRRLPLPCAFRRAAEAAGPPSGGGRRGRGHRHRSLGPAAGGLRPLRRRHPRAARHRNRTPRGRNRPQGLPRGAGRAGRSPGHLRAWRLARLHRLSRKGLIRMTASSNPDVKAYAEAMAKALDLPLTPEYAPQVEANLAVAFRLAPLFLDFALPEDTEPAHVFRAEGSPR